HTGTNPIPVTTSSMDQDRTWNLFALKLAGKATPDEWAELQMLMEDKPEIALHLQALTNFWHQHSKYDKERIEKAIKKIADSYSVKNDLPGEHSRMIKQKPEHGALKEIKDNRHSFLFMIKKMATDFFTALRNKIDRSTDSLTG
ncbi:MAG: hypothetical protein ABUT20_34090, partial [Bacteroidota bacterium]